KEFMSKDFIRLTKESQVVLALNLCLVNNYHVIIDDNGQKLLSYRDLLNYIVDFYPGLGKISEKTLDF
ncbi:MAG: hypothetical protein ACFFD1_07410, partial [Candidatus Thorarchaeota archaeon]